MYFSVANFDEDPSQITSLLGISPDSSCRKGAIRTLEIDGVRHSNQHKTGIWSIDSKLPQEAKFENHLLKMLERLEPLQTGLDELARRGYSLRMVCSIYLVKGDTGFDIPNHLIQRLANIGCELVVYLYDFVDND
jgi:hypothetical protein